MELHECIRALLKIFLQQSEVAEQSLRLVSHLGVVAQQDAQLVLQLLGLVAVGHAFLVLLGDHAAAQVVDPTTVGAGGLLVLFAIPPMLASAHSGPLFANGGFAQASALDLADADFFLLSALLDQSGAHVFVLHTLVGHWVLGALELELVLALAEVGAAGRLAGLLASLVDKGFQVLNAIIQDTKVSKALGKPLLHILVDQSLKLSNVAVQVESTLDRSLRLLNISRNHRMQSNISLEDTLEGVAS